MGRQPGRAKSGARTSGPGHQPDRSAPRGRDLGDVFHFFVDEAEQEDARARAAAAHRQPLAPGLREDPSLPSPAALAIAPRPGCWAWLVEPGRPLGFSVVADAAALWADGIREVRIVSLCDPGRLVPYSDGVRWELVADDPQAVLAALDLAPDAATLVLIGSRTHPETETALEQRVEGLILPVVGDARGMAQALGQLRKRRAWTKRLAVLATGGLVGQRDPFRTLESAARRQLGLRVESFGTIATDTDFTRSLLGTSVHELTPDGGYRENLRELCARL